MNYLPFGLANKVPVAGSIDLISDAAGETFPPPLTPSMQIDLWTSMAGVKVKHLDDGLEIFVDGATFLCDRIEREPVAPDGILDGYTVHTLINVTGGTLPQDQPGYVTLAGSYMYRLGFESARLCVRHEMEQRLDKWRKDFLYIDIASLEAALDEILPPLNQPQGE